MTPGAQIDRLREEGYTVRVAHRRPAVMQRERGTLEIPPITRAELHWLRESGATIDFAPKGGLTTVTIRNGTRSGFGMTLVHPDDQFNRRVGLTVALARALRALRER